MAERKDGPSVRESGKGGGPTPDRTRPDAERTAWKRTILMALAILTVWICIAFVLLSRTGFLSEHKYSKAMSLMDAGDYEAAYPLLNGLQLRDSPEKAAECLYHIQTARLGDVTAGSALRFGSYEQDDDLSNGNEEIEWIVLAVDGDKALLLSKYALDYRIFYGEYDSMGGCTWGRSSLRSWLNESFLSSAFGKDHRRMILSMPVKPDPNPDYDTNPGNQTVDKLFVLSYEEAESRFDSDSARRCRASAFCCAQGAPKDEEGFCWWWLRTPGQNRNDVTVVTSRGVPFSGGFCCDNPNPAVRPAMWLDLSGN